ncbi:MAG: DHH family phosphoesterase [Thermoplasmatales archaeon]|nr:DHH family phosphoesterase [Thermoplasmatales archaeon]
MLDKIIHELKNGKKLVLVHSNADPDAVGSAYALAQAFPNVTIGVHEGVSKSSKKLINKTGAEVVVNPNPDDFEKIFVVDTSTSSLLGNLAKNIRKPIIIDHHAKTSWENAKLYYHDEKPSCAEIIYEILKKADFKISRNVGLALLSGIITDTGRFRRANAETLKIFTSLLEEARITMDEVLSLVEESPDKSEKIALLKAGQRLKYETVNEYVLAYSMIGAFEGSASSALLSLGADIAVVGRQKNSEFVVIAKSKNNVPVHLGRMMDEIGRETGSGGGGHKGAAGVNGLGDAEAMVNVCVQKVKEKIKKELKHL